jgi:hypothetical protein
MEIHGGFLAQRVIKATDKERRKCHATGNQKETGKETRESAHRQGQLQHLRLARPPTEGRVKKLSPHFI